MNLARNIEFDLWFRYVDELSEQDVDAYSTLDARIGWKPVENLELTVVGQNLLSDQHSEFEPDFLGTMLTEVERGVYAKVTWLF
jgi:iron complex outermembrane receptor protein